jgi:hypothetical protein
MTKTLLTWTSVYIIGAHSEYPIKVGISGCLVDRLGFLQAGNPTTQLRILFSREFPQREEARAVEIISHEILASTEMGHEWFNATQEAGELAISQAIATVEKCKRRFGKRVVEGWRRQDWMDASWGQIGGI